MMSRSDSSAAFSASNTLPPLDEPLGPRQKIEWMAAREVLRAQPATKALLKTLDTDAATHRLQTGRLPHRIAHDVDVSQNSLNVYSTTVVKAGSARVSFCITAAALWRCSISTRPGNPGAVLMPQSMQHQVSGVAPLRSTQLLIAPACSERCAACDTEPLACG